MIFRLEYCNKASVTARVDIQKGGATPIYTVEGTADPFVLFYNNDKGDKSGSFRSSGADINIYKTTEFNIDELKTSNETEISVKYYINNILNWSGFVIPDFFSETITGGQGVVSMVASDRLGTLKGATLSGLSAKVSNRSLVDACLAQTGLSLPLYTMADFTGDTVNIFNSEVLSQRMVDTKGRNVSCYDILSSILEETNSLIVQRNGAWYIVNKLQLEAGSGSLYSSPVTSSAWAENTVSFDEVSVGARRTITPVAATVGVYHEHGSGRLHPDNYDFSVGVSGWTAVNGFVATTDNREIKLYSNGIPIYGDATSNDYLVNNNERVSGTLTLDTAPYLESASIPVVSTQSDMVDISIDVSITAPGGGSSSLTPSFVRYAVIASNGTQTYALNRSGTFEVYDPTNLNHSQTIFIGSDVWWQIVAVSKSILISGKLEIDLTGFNVKVRIYGSGTYQTTAIHFASVKFSNTAELPKGNIFKTTQGANYTKDHEIPTVLWGDYLTLGLNGYFYDYPIDDTSSLYRPTGELHSRWTAYGDPDTLPLLQHITRQKARMFSVAHDLLSADIATSTFDPLSIFVDCEGTSDETRYVVVSARFDFLRSNVSVELEEVAYVTNSKRDYIYSYFGDGEEGISSIGGISGGSVGSVSGGGLTPEQLATLNNLASWWKLDEVNDAIYSEKNVYSQKEVSAYGIGSGGSGGGGDISKLPSWAGYTPEMVDYYVSAGLLVPFYNDMQARVSDLEDGGGGGSTVTWGTESGGSVPLTVEGVSKSVALSTHTHSQYALTTHNHSGVYEPAFTKNNAFNKNFGTAVGTVAQGNDSRIINGQTAYGWGNHASAGYALSSALANYALTTHNHSGVYEPAFTKNDAFNKNFGTAVGTVAQGNDSRIVNGATAYGWGNHASAGYALNTALTAHINKVDNPHSVTKAQVGLENVDNTADSAKNVLSATKLTTARTIWGQSFNGTANVSGALTGATTIAASTSVTTPKVIFTAAGWSMEQSVEGVLELKYNGVIKQKFLNDGSIAATGELTAYVAGASGYSEFLPLSGGTLTGNLNIGTGVIIGTAAIPLSVRGSTFKYNNSDVLYKGNIGTASLPSIGFSEEWTIEVQTTPSALLIKKNGVIKGTFNA